MGAKAVARELGLAESGWATLVEPPMEPELEPLKEIPIWLFKNWSQEQQLSVVSSGWVFLNAAGVNPDVGKLLLRSDVT
jgi:hypothetical protein